jgi:hypothetical protein
VPRPSVTVAEGLAGMAKLAPLSPGGAGGAKPLLFTTHKPCQMSNVQEEALSSCARDQVVIARPPVLTSPWCYRRSLVSKGRFTTSINVVCVGIRSGLPKRRYRVVMGDVGDLLRHRDKAGCWMFRGLWRVCEFGETPCCLWVFVVVASD